MTTAELAELTLAKGGKKLECTDCPYVSCAYVPSVLSMSQVVFVGDFPSKMDVERKLPFSSVHGQEFRKILREVGLDDKAQTYLHVVCCVPPSFSEKIDKKAVKKCMGLFLDQQLAGLDPKLIVLIGSMALNHFFPKEKILDVKGNFLKIGKQTFLPVLHPAYCAQNPHLYSSLRKDLAKIRQFTEGGDLYSKRDFRLVRTEADIREALTKLLQYQRLAVDIETNNTLNPFEPTAVITVISFCGEANKAYCFPLDHPDIKNVFFRDMCKKAVKDLLVSSIEKVFHNACFDIKFLRKFGYAVHNFRYDTMVMAHLLDEHRNSIGLKQLSAEYLDGCVEKMAESLEDLARYCCEDTSNTFRLCEIFSKQLMEFPKMIALFETVLMPMVEVLAELELNGIRVDTEYLKQLEVIYTKKRETILEIIADEIPQTKNVSLDSPKQVSELLFKKLKYEPIKKTKTGFSVDEEVLNGLAGQGIALAKYLLKYRECNKVLSTYVVNLPTYIQSDGRIHSNFNICGTVTGRISSSRINMQTTPRDPKIRKMFIPSKDNVIVNLDASQIELRTAASIANEPMMIRAYLDGMDIHRLTASKILHKSEKDITKEERQKAKGCIDGNAFVFTLRGILKLEDVVIGDFIFTGDSYKKVCAMRCTGVKKALLLHNKYGFCIYATNDHEFLTTRGWVPLSIIKSNMRKGKSFYKNVVASATNPLIELYTFEEFRFTKKTYTAHQWLPPKRCTAQVAEFLGFLIAEGYFSSDGVFLTMRSRYESFERCCREVMGRFFVKSWIRGYVRFNLKKVEFSAWCKSIGCFGTSESKKVPDCIFRSPRNIQGAFLKGLWIGDGSIFVDGISWKKSGKITDIKITVKSAELIRGIQMILLQNGILSRMRQEFKPIYGFYYCLEIHVAHRLAFIELCGGFEFGALSVSKHEYIDYVGNKYFFEPQPLVHRLHCNEEYKISKVYDIEVEDDHRFVADGYVVHNCNFGFLYGAYPKGFKIYAEKAFGVKFTLMECCKMREMYFKTYSGLLRWYKETEIQLRTLGYIEYPTGRRARFPQCKGAFKIDDSFIRQAVNFPTQGSSADIVAFVISRLHQWIKDQRSSARLILTVHDSIILEAPEALVDSIKSEVDRICKMDVPAIFSWLKVPMLFDCSIGDDWGSMVEKK